MPFLPTLCTPSAGESMSPEEVNGVVANGHAIQEALQNGTLGHMLKGCKLALLAEFGDEIGADLSEEAQLFLLAATEMGAQVARLRSGLSNSSSAQEVQTTARMLGRLYDALECQGMDLPLVQQIALYAGVPVFHGLASPMHRTAGLASQLPVHSGTELSGEDARCRVLQAVLIGTLT